MFRIKESTKNHKNQFERWLNYEDSVGRKGIDIFKKNGITFVNGNEKADIGISWHGFLVNNVPKDKCVLMKNEPPIYYAIFNRRMNNPNYNKKFLFTMSSHYLDGFDQHYYTIPRYEFNLINKYFNKSRERKLCMILRNKNKSFLINEFSPRTKKYNEKSLIKFRQQIDEKLCNISNSHIYNSYGGPWEYPCYCGKIPGGGKWDVFSKYQFTLCPENSRFDGYVTEKPIQPMCCGSIPIYYGAPDVEKYVKKETFINFEEFQNIEELYNYILYLSGEEYRRFIVKMKRFITTGESNNFSSYTFACNFLKVLNEVKI